MREWEMQSVLRGPRKIKEWSSMQRKAWIIDILFFFVRIMNTRSILDTFKKKAIETVRCVEEDDTKGHIMISKKIESPFLLLQSVWHEKWKACCKSFGDGERLFTQKQEMLQQNRRRQVWNTQEVSTSKNEKGWREGWFFTFAEKRNQRFDRMCVTVCSWKHTHKRKRIFHLPFYRWLSWSFVRTQVLHRNLFFTSNPETLRKHLSSHPSYRIILTSWIMHVDFTFLVQADKQLCACL